MFSQNEKSEQQKLEEAFDYGFNKDFTGVIIKKWILDENATSITVPSTIQGLPVLEIHITDRYDRPYNDFFPVKEIKFQEGFKVLEGRLFDDDRIRFNSVSILLPEGLVEIKDNFFYLESDFYFITAINFPSSLKIIGKEAFRGTKFTEPLVLNEGLLYIGNSAFFDGNIKSLTLPSTLQFIGENAFALSSIESIAIPESIRFIGIYAFIACDNLKTIVLPEEINFVTSFITSRGGKDEVTLGDIFNGREISRSLELSKKMRTKIERLPYKKDEAGKIQYGNSIAESIKASIQY